MKGRNGTTRSANIKPQAFAVLSAILLLLSTARVPQGLYADPGWQLRATQQFVNGESPTPNTLIAPEPSDLSRDVASWISLWTPGTPLLAYPFMAAHLPIGQAIRVLASIFILLGAYGWALWIGQFELPRSIAIALAVLVPWIHYSSNGLFLYSAETLAFGCMPYGLLSARALSRRWNIGDEGSHLPALLTGLLFGAAYILKDSTALATLGVLTFLAFKAWAAYRASDTAAHRNRRHVLVEVSSVVLGFAAVGVAASVANIVMGGSANVVTALLSFRVRPMALVHAFGGPALMMADADAMFRYLLVHPDHPLLRDAVEILLLSAPGGAALLWLVATERSLRPPEQLTVAVLSVSIISIALIWNFSDHISNEARHVATAGLASLPMAVAVGLRRWPLSGRVLRAALVTGGAVYIGAPLAYGCISVAAKLSRTNDYRTAQNRLFNPLLASRDLESCRDHLVRDFEPTTDVWYLTEPMTSLELPGRAVIVHADFLPIDELRTHYRTTRRLRVLALLPRHFEDNRKGPAIRQSFDQARDWDRSSVDDCEYVKWSAILDPHDRVVQRPAKTEKDM